MRSVQGCTHLREVVDNPSDLENTKRVKCTNKEVRHDEASPTCAQFAKFAMCTAVLGAYLITSAIMESVHTINLVRQGRAVGQHGSADDAAWHEEV